jgi:tRNA(Ile)-lysidine synthase
MPVKTYWAGIPVLRPLLDMPKARLVATLESQDLDWIEDASNLDSRFERVRLRQALAGAATLGLRADALALTARRLRRARAALDQATGRFLADAVTVHDAGHCRLDQETLIKAPEEIALRALGRMLEAVGGQPGAPRLARLEALLAPLLGGRDLARTLAGCRVVAEDGIVTVLREPGRHGLPVMTLPPGACALWDRRFRVCVGGGLAEPVTVRSVSAAGLREVLSRAPSASCPPYGAGADLVSFWCGAKVLAVPHLGFVADAASSRDKRLSAVFVNKALLGARKNEAGAGRAH